ncbi:hypothetical protein ACIQUM_36845 [Amycolatopsis azurea]|uniref:hypothetical protein n=1 Tax=Amycolatopsis azurea TaxID=36819 RepID=UPI00382BB875
MDGVTDDTTTIQPSLDAADGATVDFPGGKVLHGGLRVERRLTLIGSGILSFVAEIEHTPTLCLAAPGCQADGLRLVKSSSPRHALGRLTVRDPCRCR